MPTRFAIEPMSPTLGVEVSGVDLREPLDDHLLAELWNTLLEWKLLVFNDQPLTPRQHVDFAFAFGELFDDSIGVPRKTDPMDNYVSFTRDESMPGLDNVWHTDGSFRPDPPASLTLHSIEVPPFGGDTVFSDMAAAYDNLPHDIRAQVDELDAVNDWSVGYYARAGFYGERLADIKRGLPTVRHPVARKHPITGRTTLYVNRAFTSHLVNDDEELFEYLRSQAEVPEYQVRLRWRANTFAFFDNQALQHYATNNYMPNRRVMGRATIGCWHDRIVGLTSGSRPGR